MNNQLVFVHGRAQEHKDAAALKSEWIATLQKGLKKNGLNLANLDSEKGIKGAELSVRFPYYGQTLYDLVKNAPGIANVIVRGANTDAAQQQFLQSVLKETQKKTKITDHQIEKVLGTKILVRGPLNWEWLQGILKAIDKHVKGASSKGIALATNDVYQYLKNPVIRAQIEEGVRAALTPGKPTVVVAHSLGTVVAYNVLRRHKDLVIPLFVTLGSPLAVTAIKNSLSPIVYPTCVKEWYNAMDERDVVALYPLDKRHFNIAPAIKNKTDVENQTSNHHGIAGYLNDKVVARRIYDALSQ